MSSVYLLTLLGIEQSGRLGTRLLTLPDFCLYSLAPQSARYSERVLNETDCFLAVKIVTGMKCSVLHMVSVSFTLTETLFRIETYLVLDGTTQISMVIGTCLLIPRRSFEVPKRATGVCRSH